MKHATYRGDVTHAVGQLMGPSTTGVFFVVTDAVFDPATGTTRLEFDPA